jgi:hypothetical protein
MREACDHADHASSSVLVRQPKRSTSGIDGDAVGMHAIPFDPYAVDALLAG